MPGQEADFPPSVQGSAVRFEKLGAAFEDCEALIRKQHVPARGNNENVRIVTIAASWGGIAAIIRLLEELRGDFAVPIVISQHLHPASPLTLARLLNYHSRLPVKWAENGEQLADGVVYLAVPDTITEIAARGRVKVQRFHRPDRPYRPGDILFKSAARIFGKSTLAVVLTGCLHDGTAGAVEVKQRGGRVLAQDEATSECFDMPHSAIAADAVDWVLPIESMASAISSLARAEGLVRPHGVRRGPPLRGYRRFDAKNCSQGPGSSLDHTVRAFLDRSSRLQAEARRMRLYTRSIVRGAALPTLSTQKSPRRPEQTF